MELLTREGLDRATARLAPVMRRTPLVASRVLSDRTGREVWLKCENLQRTGSFKPRGAYNRIAGLTDAERARGVVAASAGNHAQGVAWAAAELGAASTVFMPEGAPLPKLVATRSYGAQIHQVGSTVDDALVAALAFAEETGAVLIHPFDHLDVVAGQATVGREILDQMPSVGAIVVPTGGGGLVAGIAAAVALDERTVPVVGVQAAQAAAWPSSLAAGTPTPAERMSTMADGIAVGRPGDVPFAHVSALGDRMLTVSEDALSRALLLCMERAKLIVEAAGAAAVAALMDHPSEIPGDGPVVAVLSGGNIDPLLLTHVVAHGLRAAGRYLTVRIVIPDRPGGLLGVLGVARDAAASVVDVVHARTAGRLALDEVEVVMTLETRGPDHREAVLAAFATAGFEVAVQE